jgi:DNA excision repair protein ERCC-2
MQTIPAKVATYFPYGRVRPHQDEFIKTVHTAIENSESVLIEGSNGLGKTIAVLTACLPKAKQEGMQILYTAKTHRQHDRVIEELAAIAKKQQVSGVSLRARSEMCLHPLVMRHTRDARSAMEVCELLKIEERCPYYLHIEKRDEKCSELQEAMLKRPYRASEIQEVCRAERFCPYEFTKLLLSNVDVIALSYLYIFEPAICSVFLKNLEKPVNKLILVVDEAHNLPDTALEISSDSLSTFTVRQAEKEASSFNYRETALFCKQLRIIMEDMMKQLKENREAKISPHDFLETLHVEANVSEPLTFFEDLCEKGTLIRQALLANRKYPRSYVHKVGAFLSLLYETRDDTSFTHLISRYEMKKGQIMTQLEIVALDPAKITAPVFKAMYASVITSGTLQPLEAYQKITQLPEKTVLKAVPSPFPKENVLALACLGVTTAMKQRTKDMYEKILQLLLQVIDNTPANVGIFTASYEVSEALLMAGLKELSSKPLFAEHRGMSSKENANLIARFKRYAKQGGAVLVGVQGGRSSEGVDYPGDQMNTVAIVGVPYAEPTPRVEAQIKYYENLFPGHGQEYGYILQAMKKAAQAAGRPIRSLEDRGAILLMDYRYATKYCIRFFPSWIRQSLRVIRGEPRLIACELQRFFGVSET